MYLLVMRWEALARHRLSVSVCLPSFVKHLIMTALMSENPASVLILVISSLDCLSPSELRMSPGLHRLSNCALCARHSEWHLMRPWVFFNPRWERSTLFQQVIVLVGLRQSADFCRLWFQSRVFKALMQTFSSGHNALRKKIYSLLWQPGGISKYGLFPAPHGLSPFTVCEELFHAFQPGFITAFSGRGRSEVCLPHLI